MVVSPEQTVFEPRYVLKSSFFWCQYHQQRVAIPVANSAADLLGNNHPPQIVNTADNACCKNNRYEGTVVV